jgi:hypothetical protein
MWLLLILLQAITLPEVPVVWISNPASARLMADYREVVAGRLSDPHASAYGRIELDTALNKRVLRIYQVTEVYPLDAPDELPLGELVGVIRFVPNMEGPVKRMEKGACYVLSRLHAYRPAFRFYGFMYAEDQNAIAGCVLYRDEKKANYRTSMLFVRELHHPVAAL